jgi:hypothetical protein
MEARYDLRKFITELPVAQRCHVLSSGREASLATDPAGATVQGRTVLVAGPTPTGVDPDREFANVGRLTLGAGIERPDGDGQRPMGR